MKKLRTWFTLTTNNHPLAWSTFGALVLTGIVYRIRLYYGLLKSDIRPFGFDPETYPFLFTMQYVAYEIIFALIFTAFIVLFRKSLLLVRHKILENVLYFLLLVLCNSGILLVALAYGTHYRLILEMNSGLEIELVYEGLQGFSFADFIQTLWPGDILFLLFPLILFYVLYLHPQRGRLVTDTGLVVLALAALLLPVGFAGSNQPLVARELRLNPLYFALQDVLSSPEVTDIHNNSTISRERTQQQLQSVAFVDPLLVHPEAAAVPNFRQSTETWNIILIILESTGAEYVFNTSLGNPVPMPFLQQLSTQGLLLNNHYSAGNSSPRAVFSIFSGTYETPTPDFFSLRRDLKIPALNSFFPEHREQFLVTPCSTRWYFPRKFLEHNGLREIYDYHNVPVNPESPAPENGRNEIETAAFFIRRMERAQEPFFATYISFAPHYPYFDFGPEYRILPDLKNRLHRYYNALRLQDILLSKIYRSLEKQGRLERSIIIIVGDHSEAFWQHPDNRIHSLYSYNENLRSPALFWQPKLFKPAVITEPTSHVDIAPTLLFATGKPYNPALFQGENLLSGERRRRYIFAYGNENTLSIINRRNHKMQLLLRDNQCRLFNLVQDPNEKNPLPCEGHEEMQQAGIVFLRFQAETMNEYNRQYTLGRSFYGQHHPTLNQTVK